MLQLLSLTEWFFSQIIIIHDNISSQESTSKSHFISTKVKLVVLNTIEH